MNEATRHRLVIPMILEREYKAGNQSGVGLADERFRTAWADDRTRQVLWKMDDRDRQKVNDGIS